MPSALHVATTGSDSWEGSPERPLRTINRAAELARAGDTVTVHAGVYREWVRPRRGGLSDRRRITYQAAPGENVVITGSEQVTGWEPVEGTVWSASVPNALFGSFNPFAEPVDGDWLVHAAKDAPRKHLGDVYLNGKSFYEVLTLGEVSDPPRRTEALDQWTELPDHVRDPERTRYVWYAEVGADSTTIWANFQGADPRDELVEINVRRSVFYPTEHHLNYITVRGFELAQAACPWVPPTADQPGLIGPNWAKGWIIEDNDIHDAKCSAIAIGKEASTGHNFATSRGDKPGYQYQLESVFSARQIGWDAEHIGSHVIRRNTIHDCGQNAIVGHLGCVFSTIEDNHIFNIALKREFYGYEIGGIKLHAPIDVVIRHNRIHDCTLGTWLDWQAQGVRVTRNVFYNNNRDLFVEVSHGPYLVDHNVLGSAVSFESFSQGGAFVNNLLCGTLQWRPVMDRPTPYHVPHSTEVAGYAQIYGADDRYVGNVFLGGDVDRAYAPGARFRGAPGHGLEIFQGHPTTFDEYLELIEQQSNDHGEHERFPGVKQPVYTRGNVYAAGARPSDREPDATVLDGTAEVVIEEEGDEVYLRAQLPEGFDDARVGVVTGRDLERVRFVDAEFEERDGSPAVIDRDLTGVRKEDGQQYPAGPLTALHAGATRIRVW
ncbi:right-handed parallel beta-helix repeat-containing protein [Cryptosporangium japonicum]|uniref:DUF1565 domain-containing protein n=1 Tax=Cryptosporangium japonicum TaxID=80872 RepID=A0ABP3DEC9_9ACTN